MRRLRSVAVKLPLVLTCREIEELIDDYYDGTLSHGQRIVFNLHLKICRDYRSYLASYRRSVALGKAVFAEPDNPIPENLVKAILAAHAKDA